MPDLLPDLLSDFALLRHNAFGFDVRARLAAHVDSEAGLLALLAEPRLAGVPLTVLGAGSNVVLTGDIDGCVLLMAIKGNRLVAEDADAWYVEAGAGENWHAFVEATVRAGRPGLENLALIPGTVGAAPIQNIGAYGLEMAERVERVRAIDIVARTAHEFDRHACQFGYRDSFFKRAGRGRFIVTSVTFRLAKHWQPIAGYADVARALQQRQINAPQPIDIFDAVVAIRRVKLPDPAQLGNAGSFFKNPVVSAARYADLKRAEPELVGYPAADGTVKLAAGWLIDRCGWKGRTHGAAAVHERQALVLVNRGGASGATVLQLADAIRGDVERRFGVALDIEPVVV